MVDTRNLGRYYIGEWSSINQDGESSETGGIIIDKNYDLMFKMRVLSSGYKNVTQLVNVYHPEIQHMDFADDIELDDENRKLNFAEWARKRVFFFQIEAQPDKSLTSEFRSSTNYVARNVTVQKKDEIFDSNFKFESIPIIQSDRTITNQETLNDYINTGKAISFPHTNVLGSLIDDISSFLIFQKSDQSDEIGFLYEPVDVSELAPNSLRYKSTSMQDTVNVRQINTAEWLNYSYYHVPLAENILFIPTKYLHDDALETNTQLISTLTGIENDKNDSSLFTSEINNRSSSDNNQSKDAEQNFLQNFKDMTRSKKYNLTLDDDDLVSFYLSVKTNALTILSGLSGTGKSKITTAFADALGILNTDQFKMISVRPSWQDDTDLLGYADTIHNIYRPADSGLVEILKSAQDNPNKMYIVVLDEMNLARVEHYFSQFISVLERSNDEREIQLYNEKLGSLYNGDSYPGSIKIGTNVRFIGTVNVDESTFSFSDKLLDRANIIELKLVPFTERQEFPSERDVQALKNESSNSQTESYQTELATSMNSMRVKKDKNGFTSIELKFLWDLDQLFMSNLPDGGFGWRTIDNIEGFVASVSPQMHFSRSKAFDYQIAQRILPKLRGTQDNFQEILTLNNQSNVVTGPLVDLLDANQQLSSFDISKTILLKKAKELQVTGFVS